MGTYVRAVLPDHLLEVRGRGRRGVRDASTPLRLSAAAERARVFGVLEDSPPRAFRSNLPAVEEFPTATWAQLAARRYRRVSAATLRGCPVLGHPALRQAIAEHLQVSRGVRATGDQVAIVSGAQEALDLVARLLLDPGDRAGVEDPGYPGAAAAFAAAGAEVVSVGIDADGAVVPSAAASLRLVYLTPAHQCPLGVTMSLERRLAFLDWARRSSALLVEDDYDSEYRYRGRPVPALHGLDRHGRVIYIGTFNKVLFPSLRLGFVVVPDALVDRLAALKSITTRHAPVLEQLVLLDFMAGGHFGRHLRRMRETYAARLQALRDAVDRYLRPGSSCRTSRRACRSSAGSTAGCATRRRRGSPVHTTSRSRRCRAMPGRCGAAAGSSSASARSTPAKSSAGPARWPARYWPEPGTTE